jgi:hypothetical protein
MSSSYETNPGNAKILNADTHNDLLTETHMTNYQYTLVQYYHFEYLGFEKTY